MREEKGREGRKEGRTGGREGGREGEREVCVYYEGKRGVVESKEVGVQGTRHWIANNLTVCVCVCAGCVGGPF